VSSGGQVKEAVARRYAVLRPYLDERQRRLVLAAEAAELGRGGITVVAQATGVHPDTVAKGVRELDGGVEPAGRVRAPGGGRKPATELDPGLEPALRALVDPETRGDPESPLVRTTKSTKNLAAALARDGHVISDQTVARLLRAQGFSLQANAKVTEGRQHVDRDALRRCLGEHERTAPCRRAGAGRGARVRGGPTGCRGVPHTAGITRRRPGEGSLPRPRRRGRRRTATSRLACPYRAWCSRSTARSGPADASL